MYAKIINVAAPLIANSPKIPFVFRYKPEAIKATTIAIVRFFVSFPLISRICLAEFKILATVPE